MACLEIHSSGRPISRHPPAVQTIVRHEGILPWTAHSRRNSCKTTVLKFELKLGPFFGQ